MSARAIVTGVLFKAPVSKTSKAGKPYVLATIREGSGERVRWWKCFAFSEAPIEELQRLGDGAIRSLLPVRSTPMFMRPRGATRE